MGYERTRLEVYASLERHNCEGDRLDDAAWEHFQAEVSKLAVRPEYSRLRLEVS